MSDELSPVAIEKPRISPQQRKTVGLKLDFPSHLSSSYGQDFYSKPHDQLAKLSLFLHGAHGHKTDLQPTHLPLDNVSTGFLRRLNEDLHAQSFTAELETFDFGMDIRINFTDQELQTVCLLKMQWRID